jgi:hypothetical protein
MSALNRRESECYYLHPSGHIGWSRWWRVMVPCQFVMNTLLILAGGLSSWLQIQRSRVRFPALLDFLRSSGSGTGSTQPRENKWGATWKKSSGSGLEIRDYGHRDLSCWPRGTLYPQKLALTSPTSGVRSVGIVHSRNQATAAGFLSVICMMKKLAITSPTSGGRSVGIVRSRTQTMEFSLVFYSQRVCCHMQHTRWALLCEGHAEGDTFTVCCGMQHNAWDRKVQRLGTGKWRGRRNMHDVIGHRQQHIIAVQF